MTKSWVRLQVEPVEVAADADNVVLFHTVQSVVPGAHGLYYRENGQRKALDFDQNGKVSPPPDGWHAQNIYVHLAHGHRHNSHVADYSKANEHFEKNITAVQKLIAAAGLTANFRSSRMGGRSHSKVKSGFEAQPENVHISDESDSAVVSQSADVKKDATPQENQPQINSEVEELKLQVKDLKRQLREKREKRSADPEQSVTPKDESKDKNRLEMLEAIQQEQAELIRSKDERIAELNKELESTKQKLQEQQEKDEEINNLHTVIEGLREKLEEHQKEHKDLSVSLVDHQELLKNAKDKLTVLETQVAAYSSGEAPLATSPRPRSRNTSESHDDPSRSVRAAEAKLQVATSSLRASEAEKQKLQEANWYANEKIAKLEKEYSYLKGLNEELRNRLQSSSDANLLAEKERMISVMAEERAKLEWRLGELSQWWNDAKWKIGELESGVAHQRFLLDTANNKIKSLNEQLIISLRAPQAPVSFTNPTYAIRQNYGGQWQLNNNSFGFPTAVPTIPAQILPSLPTISVETKRVILKIDNPENKEVFILSSFLNWQAALRCDLQVDGKAAVVVDLPRGKHEFRFLFDGRWCTSSEYATAPNGFGGNNNIVVVE